MRKPGTRNKTTTAKRTVNRRSFLHRCAAGSCGFPLVLCSSKARPNVLWLIAEDFCPDLGCYGEKLVHTPHIDRLAQEGTRYTNAFTTAPVCSPSRSGFMTAMYQTSIGAHQHRTAPKKPLPEPVAVITEYFRKAGYFTANSAHGNWKRFGKTDFNFTCPKPFDGTDWRQRKPGQPFFLQVNFSQTHRTFSRDPDRPIDPSDVTLPPYYPDHPLARRDWADYLECAQVLDKKVGAVLTRLEEDGLAEDTVVFFFADNGRPHIRGKQFLYEGGIHIPLIVRWPGMVKEGYVTDELVSAIDFGPTCMDLAGIALPSYLHGQSFLGANARKRSRVFAARDRCDETYDRIRCVREKRYKYIRNFYPHLPYMQPNMYKYRQYPMCTLVQVLYAEGALTEAQAAFAEPCRPAEELYDLRSDPFETRNLAGDPAHQGTVAALRERLQRWITQTGDNGEDPEDPRIAAEFFRKRHLPGTRRTLAARGLRVFPNPKEYLAWWERRLFGRTGRSGSR